MTRFAPAIARRLAFVALAALATPALFAAEVERTIEKSTAARPGLVVELRNLAGNVTVVGATGSEVRLVATVHGGGSSRGEAERVAGLLDLAVTELDGRWAVKAVYPLGESHKYHYPRREGSESLPWILDWVNVGNSNFKYDNQRVSVTSSAGGGALTLYADFRLEIPAGIATTVKNGVGIVLSQGVDGNQNLDISSGRIAVRDSRGRLGVDTGSGDVAVIGHDGELDIDTGSGDVTLESVHSALAKIDTGSGDIRMTRLTGSLDADTGSGDIVGTGLRLGPTLRADTGSGDVRLAGDFAGLTRIAVDTGSGDVTLNADAGTASPSVRMSIDTGSGEIRCDLPSTRITRYGHGEMRLEIGDAAGTATISTGSGDIVLRSAS